MPKCAIFADTQDEPKSVYTWLYWLEKQLPFPVHRVTAGKLSQKILKLKERKDGSGLTSQGGIPTFNLNPSGTHGHAPRQCTFDFKVVPLEKAAKKIGGIKRGQNTVGVIQWIGISLDEAHRMKPARPKWAENRWPLIEKRIRRSDCLRWMKEHHYPEPPRSACVFCPYHSDAQWRHLRDKEPEAFAEAVRVDKEYRRVKSVIVINPQYGVPYLHASRVPLDEVDFSTDEDHGQQVMFGNECEGMCGV